MKAFKSLFAVIVVGLSTILLAGNAYAEWIPIPYDVKDKASFKIMFPNNQNTFINLSDAEGRLLLRETFKKGSSTARSYDFSNVEDGIYTFYSETGYANVTIKVRVKKSSIEMISNEVNYKPLFIIQDNSLLVTYLNYELEELELVIYNSYADFYKSTEGNSQVFRKKFDISDMESGEYFAEIIVGGKNYTHSFNID